MKFPNPLSPLTDLFIKNVANKFLSSLLKGIVALVLAILAAVASVDPVSILQNAGVNLPTNLVLPIWGAFLVLLKAAVSALNRAKEFDLSKVK